MCLSESLECKAAACLPCHREQMTLFHTLDPAVHRGTRVDPRQGTGRIIGTAMCVGAGELGTILFFHKSPFNVFKEAF